MKKMLLLALLSMSYAHASFGAQSLPSFDDVVWKTTVEPTIDGFRTRIYAVDDNGKVLTIWDYISKKSDEQCATLFLDMDIDTYDGCRDVTEISEEIIPPTKPPLINE